jgi:dTMP kinase
LPMVQNRVRKERVFVAAVFAAGFAIIGAASMWSLSAAAFMVLLLGLCAGTAYVLGFTLIQESVDDDLRGRIFSALLTLVRLCVLLALMLGPILNTVFSNFSEEVLGGSIEVFGWTISLPGVRLTLWLAGSVIVLAGLLAYLSLKGGSEPPTRLTDVEEPVASKAGQSQPVDGDKHLRTDANELGEVTI